MLGVSPRLLGTLFGALHLGPVRSGMGGVELRPDLRGRIGAGAGVLALPLRGRVGMGAVATELPACGLRVPCGDAENGRDGLLPERRVDGPVRPDVRAQIECYRLIADVLGHVAVLEA